MKALSRPDGLYLLEPEDLVDAEIAQVLRQGAAHGRAGLGLGTERYDLLQAADHVEQAIAAVGTYTALGAWNQFLFPLILTQDPSMRVLTLSLTSFKQEFQINVPGMMMAVMMTALPVFVLYLVARRWLIAGLAGVGSK